MNQKTVNMFCVPSAPLIQEREASAIILDDSDATQGPVTMNIYTGIGIDQCDELKKKKVLKRN